MEEKKKYIILTVLFCIILNVMLVVVTLLVPVNKAYAAEKKYTYNFIYIKDKVKYEMTYSSDEPCILFKRHGGTGLRGMRCAEAILAAL